MPVNAREAFVEAYRQGWTQAQFAERLGIHATTLWRIKTGQLTPSLAFRERLKRVFPHRNVDDLIQVTEDGHGDHGPVADGTTARLP